MGNERHLGLKKFVFGPMQENTYVVYGPSLHCWIIDPGCYFTNELHELVGFIQSNNLKPVRLLLTHCHIDHVFGAAAVCETFGLKPEYHRLETDNLNRAPLAAQLYGLKLFDNPPPAQNRLSEGETLLLDNQPFEVHFAPGHSPGHLVFINRVEGYAISGDVVFKSSIGRTDLPGGDHDMLMRSIGRTILSLPDEVVLHSGHGPQTTVGAERRSNPFLRSVFKSSMNNE